ncbi:MAG: hypothetical protein RBR46_02280 [Acholeplasmatales bacterium]|jgi:hypothetical protein|nr:hypothetical protein [Acholeplasmatales bacterium]
MSNKQTKKNYQKPNTQKKQYEDVPAFKSPAKTLWGKIIILIIVIAMVGASIAGLIVALINF